LNAKKTRVPTRNSHTLPNVSLSTQINITFPSQTCAVNASGLRCRQLKHNAVWFKQCKKLAL